MFDTVCDSCLFARYVQSQTHIGVMTPCELYANAVAVGQRKAKLVSSSPKKTFMLALIAGAYISIGELLI